MYTLKNLSVTTDLIKPCFSGSSVRRHYQSGGFGISADSENTDSNCFTEEPSTILKALLPIGLCLLIMYVIQSFVCIMWAIRAI